MRYLFDEPLTDFAKTGEIRANANQRRFQKTDQFYYLGREGEKYFYVGTLAEVEDEAVLDVKTIKEAADYIDYLNSSEPTIYNSKATIAKLTEMIRDWVAAAAAPAPAPAPAVPSAIAMPTGPLPAKVPLAPFNNGKPANGATWFGATIGDGKHDGRGWPKGTDIDTMVALGVKCIRLPLKSIYCLMADGTLNAWVMKNLSGSIKRAIAAGVSVVLDWHSYLPFSDPAVWQFWCLFGPAIEKAIGGPTPMFGIELANEPGKASKDLVKWTEPLRTTIKLIRFSGYQGYIFAGAGDWNNMQFLPIALAEVERTGGVLAMDPFDRTIYTGHDYWNWDSNSGKRRNDQGASVLGTIDIAKRYDPALAVARRIKAKIAITEIGGGISPNGPLPAYNGQGKNGQQIQEEFFAYAKANEDVLIGTWFWMSGKTDLGYRHKIEAGNPHTKSLQGFWK